MIRLHLTGDWEKAHRMMRGDLIVAFRHRLQQALNETADLAAEEIVNAIVSGGRSIGMPFLPNAPFTIRLKGSDKPLIDTGNYQNSIKAIHGAEGEGSFAGPDPKATNAHGVPLSLIAAVNEQGLLIKVGTRSVFIPPRPHIRPVAEKIKLQMIRLVREAAEQALEDIS